MTSEDERGSDSTFIPDSTAEESSSYSRSRYIGEKMLAASEDGEEDPWEQTFLRDEGIVKWFLLCWFVQRGGRFGCGSSCRERNGRDGSGRASGGGRNLVINFDVGSFRFGAEPTFQNRRPASPAEIDWELPVDDARCSRA